MKVHFVGDSASYVSVCGISLLEKIDSFIKE